MNPTPPLLPVAELDDTLRRFLNHIRPLLDDHAYAQAESDARAFWRDTAPALQQALQQRAQSRPDSSWLIDTWLNSYLSIRTPLPLASNVGFGIPMHGADIAQWCAAMAGVCADWHHQRIETPVSPQGAPVCMEQWRILAGAARIPAQGCDEYRFATHSRHIGVLHQGWYYRVPALDEHGEALSADHFRAVFAHIGAQHELNPYPVSVPVVLGGDDSARLYADLRREPANAALLDAIADDLFHISLYHEALSADEDLARATFAPDGGIWFYKPLTFCHNLATQRLFLHVEHTWEDGGALKGMIARAVAKLSDTEQTATAAESTAPVRQSWQLSPEQQHNWAKWQQQYARRARAMHVHSFRAPLNGITIPKGISQDALMQFALQYGQLVAFGKVRNTYEAVDVSHFLRGRTECVRPVSVESLAFVQSLLTGSAAGDAFTAALAEHKARIKTAKTGLGANRHLLGLHTEARAAGADTSWFEGEAYQLFTQDFLSTSTVGDDALVRNFAFAPTSEGGLGVNYTLTSDAWLFTVSFHADQAVEAARFAAAVQAGAQHILQFIAQM
ncbi:choline/carnitine O-acyltransferase [Conchiformibius steedae DSM 2580]|uniref:Choline/carnitine O-acyltransferase n=1 Tax=Conchiformibius steedae DSM 2580 TaxID=1121352 RepID=A0AAE9HUE1_9NEIS|nr:choline/carnitine O-acyltransferase [Conchiformibius steedae]QMT33168.1 choline/carnitine O-acyltransferase [Conchiformibius steedae]URD67804.1 choline/carnitine O-acyltransferase [Conchiformibius steedae DSM 2580]